MDEKQIINWDCILVIIELFNTLIIIIPAIITFIYFRFKKINIISLSKENGSIIAIHNISKNVVFIKDISICYKEKQLTKKNKKSIIDNNDLIELEPNQTHKVKIDYVKYGIKEYEKKKIIVSLNNSIRYTKRIRKTNDN